MRPWRFRLRTHSPFSNRGHFESLPRLSASEKGHCLKRHGLVAVLLARQRLAASLEEFDWWRGCCALFFCERGGRRERMGIDLMMFIYVLHLICSNFNAFCACVCVCVSVCVWMYVCVCVRRRARVSICLSVWRFYHVFFLLLNASTPWRA